jgi:hypothetical protein
MLKCGCWEWLYKDLKKRVQDFIDDGVSNVVEVANIGMKMLQEIIDEPR